MGARRSDRIDAGRLRSRCRYRYRDVTAKSWTLRGLGRGPRPHQVRAPVTGS